MPPCGVGWSGEVLPDNGKQVAACLLVQAEEWEGVSLFKTHMLLFTLIACSAELAFSET